MYKHLECQTSEDLLEYAYTLNPIITDDQYLITERRIPWNTRYITPSQWGMRHTKVH